MNKDSGSDGISAKLFKIVKLYAIKVLYSILSANLGNSAVATGLGGQFSFQSQRRAMPKNVQTTGQLCSFNMLARLCSKSFKLGISSIWTKNLQMYKLGLEKAERSEIILLTLLDQRKSKGISEKASTSVSLTILKVLTGWITTNCRKFLKWYEFQTTLLVS